MPARSAVLYDPQLEPDLRSAGLRTAADVLALARPAESTRVQERLWLPTAEPVSVYLKAHRYPTRRRARHLLGRGTLWGPPPEMREFRVLEALRRHGLPAVRPVVAAAAWSGPWLRAQAIATLWVPGAADLASRLSDPQDPLRIDGDLRRRVLSDLAALVWRMHRCGLAHRDLFARNVLVRLEGPAPDLILLDCRRGGTGNRRAFRREKALLLEDLGPRLSPPERQAFGRALGIETVRGRA